ncbi:hypothetical protein [Flavobacterium wongokense]|uniref:hypothetical protein n=1 Tax=Flavobacterium wongokense TaxID=2910674 RepID=UPI001F41CF71|nr:hypothetical protein [Flavobacterium sp. WG47]MCF6131465.1 hypothetical protein [Flavobacterium sp. WG47]
MKTRIILSVLLATIFFTGCKDEKSVDSLEVVKTEEAAKIFQVTLDVTVKKDDNFALFYTEDGTINFTGDPIWIGVKGSDAPQKVVFNLPENVIPTMLRIDFGISKDQDVMTINNYKMTYAGKSFETPGATFFKYFRPNEQCTQVDREKGLVIPVKNQAKYFGPSFYPEITLGEEIAKLVK